MEVSDDISRIRQQIRVPDAQAAHISGDIICYPIGGDININAVVEFQSHVADHLSDLRGAPVEAHFHDPPEHVTILKFFTCATGDFFLNNLGQVGRHKRVLSPGIDNRQTFISFVVAKIGCRNVQLYPADSNSGHIDDVVEKVEGGRADSGISETQ
ncbi:unnamed protein product [Cuscuta epithymum]|uniref:Uncharacterized protein n=1 Tax=Cuscuta epithymum TaxID=186058 RepID=A0AAV0FUE9_9ASTE|nr:unnamed protein product [Cuscuta epithymum]